jgi:hypothetical protein
MKEAILALSVFAAVSFASPLILSVPWSAGVLAC